MAVAIDTSHLALYVIPEMQRELDWLVGEGRRLQIHRVSVYASILTHDSELLRQPSSILELASTSESRSWGKMVAKQEALEWQADPNDDLGDAAVLHHLHQQAATVPFLSSVSSQSDCGHAATTLTGSALSASINARTQGRLLSSFHRHSHRLSYSSCGALRGGVSRRNISNLLTPYRALEYMIDATSPLIVWAGSQRDNYPVFLQVQVDVVDLFSRSTPASRPRKRLRTSFNQFLQVSHSPVVEDTSRRGNPLPHTKRFNGVRYRPDRKIYVAEMKPPKHKTKQDFGNFKSEAEAARAVDAAFHHYGRPDLLNFPHTSLHFLSTRPTAPAGMDEKTKVKFVKEEARLLLAAMAASSPPHSTHTNSLQIQELPASPRLCSSVHFCSLSEISSPSRSSGPEEVDAVVSQPQPRMLLDSICDISTTRVPTNLETLHSVQHAEEGWDGANDSSPLAAPPNAVNPSTYESQSMSLYSLQWSPAPTYLRSPSPSHFQEEIAYDLLEHQASEYGIV